MKNTKAKNTDNNELPSGVQVDQIVDTEADGGSEGPNGSVRSEVTAEAAAPPATRTGEQEPQAQSGEPGTADTVESLQAKVASLEDSLLRAKADYQNLQKRGARERSEAIRYANAELMQSLLVVVDDFERSVASTEDCGEAKAIVDGVRLVYENLMKALRGHGLETIDALHRPFDPHVHQAVMQQPTTDHSTGTVIDEITRGYRLRDRVLRPAKVVVAKAVDHGQVQDSNGEKEGTTA